MEYFGSTLRQFALAIEHAREGNSNGRIVRHCLVRLELKLVVAQFCRAKDHEIFDKGAECVRSCRKRDVVFALQPASYELATAQPIAQSVCHEKFRLRRKWTPRCHNTT